VAAISKALQDYLPQKNSGRDELKNAILKQLEVTYNYNLVTLSRQAKEESTPSTF
jgi:hypothetical protein